MNIKQMSVEQLKTLVYDQLVLIEQSQKNVQALNQEINLRKEIPSETIVDKQVIEHA